ncbi:MAG: hypothetical protein JW744_02190 [Candidatus Diapherotrites archaeon]|uniref:Uncharacterized protein n=1 Tax=Candidatus Iainarchaeum sp. TaxID=3101447 RepID=A0A938YN61_9ARCH|nr:hypothetical protein [Candidatus Diapherotrites archaeon]
MARVSWLRSTHTRALPRFRATTAEKAKHLAAGYKKGRLGAAVERKIKEIGLEKQANEIISRHGLQARDEKSQAVLRLELLRRYVAEARKGKMRKLTNRVEGTCLQFAEDTVKLQLFLRKHPDLLKSKPTVISKEEAIEIFGTQARIMKNILGMYSKMPEKDAKMYRDQLQDAVKNANEMRSAQPGKACQLTRPDRIAWALENAEEAIHEVVELLPKDTQASFHFIENIVKEKLGK